MGAEICCGGWGRASARHLDESGQEWGNLLAASSGPIVAYGSTSLTDPAAQGVLDAFRPAGLSPKDKSKAWLKPDTVEAAVAAVASAPVGSIVVGLAHRPWFAVAKVVSLAVDEGHFEATGGTFETLTGSDGVSLGSIIATAFWEQVRVPGGFELGPHAADALLDFQRFVVRGDGRAGSRFARWAAERSVERSEELIQYAWWLASKWTTAELSRQQAGEGRTWSARDLAPNLPLLVEVLREWGRRVGNSAFEVVHDRSSEVEHHLREFLSLGQHAEERWASAPGHVSLPAFIPGTQTTFMAKSPGLAFADLVAGAVRLWITARLARGSLSNADWRAAERLDAVAWLPMVGDNCHLGP